MCVYVCMCLYIYIYIHTCVYVHIGTSQGSKCVRGVTGPYVKRVMGAQGGPGPRGSVRNLQFGFTRGLPEVYPAANGEARRWRYEVIYPSICIYICVCMCGCM